MTLLKGYSSIDSAERNLVSIDSGQGILDSIDSGQRILDKGYVCTLPMRNPLLKVIREEECMRATGIAFQGPLQHESILGYSLPLFTRISPGWQVAFFRLLPDKTERMILP